MTLFFSRHWSRHLLNCKKPFKKLGFDGTSRLTTMAVDRKFDKHGVSAICPGCGPSCAQSCILNAHGASGPIV